MQKENKTQKKKNMRSIAVKLVAIICAAVMLLSVVAVVFTAVTAK